MDWTNRRFQSDVKYHGVTKSGPQAPLTANFDKRFEKLNLKKGPDMNALDQALEKFIQDDNEQTRYYDLVLNTRFYIPTAGQAVKTGTSRISHNDSISPIVIEADGKRYMMLFDSEERLASWAKKPVNYITFPGYAIVDMSTPDLHWAMNVGTDFSKEFVPDEIRWLKDAVKKHRKELIKQD